MAEDVLLIDLIAFAILANILFSLCQDLDCNK